MTLNEEQVGLEKAYGLCKRYGIDVVDGIIQKPTEEKLKKIQTNLFVEYMGLAYSLGNARYDKIDDEHVRDMNGKFKMMGMLMNILDINPLKDILLKK